MQNNLKVNTKIFFSRLFRDYFISYFLISFGLLLFFLGFGSTIFSESQYYLDKITNTTYVLDNMPSNSPEAKKPDNLLNLLTYGRVVKLKPVSTNDIIIEKIGVNAPVIKNVSVDDEEKYFEALKMGVAHAKGKPFFGEVGNVYLFAHSSLEFWKLGPYATVFNQIRRLENGDVIHTYASGKRYDYVVFDKYVVKGFDLTPIKENYSTSVLTLQTCDPPGTQLNRLIVKARLINY